MSTRHLIAFAAAALMAQSALALEGKLLVVDNTQRHYGGDISIVDCATGVKTKIQTGYCWGPVFSPDGTRIAYAMGGAWPEAWVVVCDLDGGNKLMIPAQTFPWDMCNLSWADDGYIYWTAKSQDFRRVPATGGPEESFKTFPAIVGISGQEGISSGDMCNDATRGAGTEFRSGNNEVHALSVATGTSVNSTLGHCNGSISPGGNLVCANQNSHQTADIYDFTSWNIVHTVTAPAAAGGFTGVTFSNSSNTHVVYVSEHEPTQAYVCDMTTNTSYHICAGQPFDYFAGGQPPQTPRLSLEPTSLSFSAEEGGSGPSDQTVNVTNSGEGTLATVTAGVSYSGGSGWLTATPGGSGNSQTIDNVVVTDWLSAGSYSATVTVHCSNASPSSAQYSVSLEITQGPDESPTATASADPAYGRSPVDVQFTGAGTPYPGRWMTGYHWDFGDGATSTEQNPTHTYGNTGGTVIVRTATLTVTDNLGDTGTDTVSITIQPWAGYTFIVPEVGDIWYVGTTRHIRYTASNASTAVFYYRTSPTGNWKAVLPPGTGQIAVNDPRWGNYPWVVADDPSAECSIEISEYMNQAEAAVSEQFEIARVVDLDGDGMDDDWEAATFGDLSHDETTDADGDGKTDYDEFMAGTDPEVAEGASTVGWGCAAGAVRVYGLWACVMMAAGLALILHHGSGAASLDSSPRQGRGEEST